MKITDKRMMEVVLQASITSEVQLRTQSGARVKLLSKDTTNSLVRSSNGSNYNFLGRNVARQKEDECAIVSVCTNSWLPMTKIKYADDLLWFIAAHGKSHLEVETVRGWRKLTESEPLLPVTYRVSASFLKTMNADFLYTIAAILKTTEKQLRAVSVEDVPTSSYMAEISIEDRHGFYVDHISEDKLHLNLCKDDAGRQFVVMRDAPFAVYGE